MTMLSIFSTEILHSTWGILGFILVLLMSGDGLYLVWTVKRGKHPLATAIGATVLVAFLILGLFLKTP